eukprot:m.420607 g.420607  ORF g.420607 m.420607 type:complete len:875 (+) comp16846_c2_seq21:4661-7285(+)
MTDKAGGHGGAPRVDNDAATAGSPAEEDEVGAGAGYKRGGPDAAADQKRRRKESEPAADMVALDARGKRIGGAAKAEPKRRRVGGGSLFEDAEHGVDTFADAVIRSKGTVLDSDMPFVNRHEELWDLFKVNAENMAFLRTAKGAIDNFRPWRMLFCVQYFGSGKTTLGRVFFEQIQTPDVQKFFEMKVKGDTDLEHEWAELKTSLDSAVHVPLVVADVPDVLRAALAVATGVTYDAVNDPFAVRTVAAKVVEFAERRGPTLLHFDEVGSDKGHNINDIRRLAVAVWTELHSRLATSGRSPMVYFLVTGRSTEPFQSIGRGSVGSPCGNHFLVLDLLKAEHVGDVRQWLSGADIPAERRLKLNNLTDADAGCYLDRVLTDATGGAPRLLLYTLRALAYLQCSLGSNDEIDSAMNSVYSALTKVPDIAREFIPSRSDADAKLEFSYLLALSLSGVLNVSIMEQKFVVSGREVSVATMMRFQPFFLSRVDKKDVEHFTLELPLFYRRRAAQVFGTGGVPMLLLALSQSRVEAHERWRLFELVVPHAVAVRAAFRKVGVAPTPSMWADALPNLFGKSNIAKALVFDLGAKPFECTAARVTSGWGPEGVPPDLVSRGTVFPPDKAPSEDAFHFQRKSDGTTAVVGWQMKLFEATTFTLATLRDEVGKCMKVITEVFVVTCTRFGAELGGVIAKNGKVLVLGAWDDTTSAEYAMGSEQLLVRAAGAEKWCVFPTKGETSDVPKNSTVVTVRSGLEVVLPHPEVVSELVGKEIMKSLRGRPNPELIVTGLGQVLSKMTADAPAAAAVSDTVVISVQLAGAAGAAVNVEFSRADPPGDVKDGICLALGLGEGTRFKLLTTSGAVRVVNGSLSAGNYTVEVVP